MLQIFQSLIATHHLMSSQSHKDKSYLQKVPAWHEEMLETIKGFRKRFSRLLGDLKYFMNFNSSEDTELKTICDQLGKTEIVGLSGFMRTGLEQLSLILTGEALGTYNSGQGHLTPHRFGRGSDRNLPNAGLHSDS